MDLPARIDDSEIAELRWRLISLSMESQARVLEGLLTPGLRLRLMAEQIRHQLGPLTDEQEALAERELTNPFEACAARRPVTSDPQDARVLVRSLDCLEQPQ